MPFLIPVKKKSSNPLCLNDLIINYACDPKGYVCQDDFRCERLSHLTARSGSVAKIKIQSSKLSFWI
jgi:hypothetical protein